VQTTVVSGTVWPQFAMQVLTLNWEIEASGCSKGWPGGHGTHGSPVRDLPPCKIGCKVARLHNSCIHSVTSHS